MCGGQGNWQASVLSFHYGGSIGNQTLVVWPGDKHFYLLIHLASPFKNILSTMKKKKSGCTRSHC